MDIVYKIAILPIETLLILILNTMLDISEGNVIISLLMLSIIFNFLLLPFYIVTDKVQRKDLEVQKLLEPKLKEFRWAYSGYERYLMISELYRKHNYKVYYSLRSTLPILIQIPVFIAAYIALSEFKYEQVGNITLDYSKPDQLLSGVNILPIIMFLINCASVYFYSPLLTFKQTMNSLFVGVIFLILLYNSASGLVIYWIFNNTIGLIKNIYFYGKEQKIKIFNNLFSRV